MEFSKDKGSYCLIILGVVGNIMNKPVFITVKFSSPRSSGFAIVENCIK
jgi:uncharacterized membrane protein YeaQ/YmgE (transglycosylase-associated protein family)